MIAARIRQSEYDRLNHAVSFARRMAADENITDFQRVDAAKDILFLDSIGVTPDGQGLTMRAWGGFAGWTHNIRFTVETDKNNVFDASFQFIIESAGCNGCLPPPPPGWPFPPPSASDSNLDAGIFDGSNNTGNCPVVTPPPLWFPPPPPVLGSGAISGAPGGTSNTVEATIHETFAAAWLTQFGGTFRTYTALMELSFVGQLPGEGTRPQVVFSMRDDFPLPWVLGSLTANDPGPEPRVLKVWLSETPNNPSIPPPRYLWATSESFTVP